MLAFSTLSFFLLFVLSLALNPCKIGDEKYEKCILMESLSRKNVSEIIRYYGYPCEVHDVYTDDGYILSVQRIPSGRKQVPRKNQVLYLQHGLLDSSFAWIANLPTHSLAYLLADEGYDVWLGNIRGNTYGKKHTKYSIEDKRFWKFSFDEMAKYDLPAIVNYILKVTGHTGLHYVGHSQGCMIAFIEFGRNNELASKIKSYHALAPVAYIGHIQGGLQVMSNFASQVEWIYYILGYNEFLSNNWFFRYISDIICSVLTIAKEVCGYIIFSMIGFDKKNMDMDRIGLYTTHTPAGTSVMNAVHFIQMVKNNKFQMYDYGTEEKNQEKYKQPYPPAYNVTAMKVPVAVFSGSKDWLADPYDFNKLLLPKLQNVVYKKNMPHYNHLDFTWGQDAHKLVYSVIIKRLNHYSYMFNSEDNQGAEN